MTTRVLTHSGPYRSDECPVIGCGLGRNARAQVNLRGRQRVVTGCERHLALLTSRAVMRVVARDGQDAVVAFVDGG